MKNKRTNKRAKGQSKKAKMKDQKRSQKTFASLVDMIEVDENFLQYLENKEDIQGKYLLPWLRTLMAEETSDSAKLQGPNGTRTMFVKILRNKLSNNLKG